MKTENKAAQPPGDKIYSTYWWEIVLDHAHPRNYNPNVKQLTGYSKLQGHDEMKDKEMLLMKRILMLATNGYLDAAPNRVKYIAIYKRGGTLILKNQDDIICTLLPRDFEMRIADVGKHPKVVKFLKDLYDHLKTGKNIQNLLPKEQEKFSKDEYFDITRYNFPSQSHLYLWAERKIQDGHSFLQVQSFVAKYLERKPFMTNEPIKQLPK